LEEQLIWNNIISLLFSWESKETLISITWNRMQVAE